MTGRLPITKTGMLKLGIFAGALFLVAAVLYGGFSWRPHQGKVTDDRAFDSTGTECDGLDLDQYSELITPIYLPWEAPTKRNDNERPGYASVTCYSQTTVAEDFCVEDQSDDCIDWYNEPVVILNQFYVEVKYHESAEVAASSQEKDIWPSVETSDQGVWDDIYQARTPLSTGQQVELTSILRVENMTIEMHSIIGRPLQTEATMDQIVAIHYAIADELARAAEI